MQTFSSHVDGYYDVHGQMIDDLRRRAAEHFRRREAERAALTSVAAFEDYRARVRDAFISAIGGLPEMGAPLNAELTGTIDRGAYHIEKLLYQSVPGVYVTAALYVPHDLAGPVPAVLFVCGHAETGKAYPNYQAVAVDLVRSGFVVLAMDPPGQGERYQYWDSQAGRRVIGGCTTEHSVAGMQFTLQGASVARHFIHDARRAIDYLQSRPEVDGERIGLTGNSGGGTQSALLMMVEPRLTAAVPSTFIMTLESYFKTGQAQDAEQIVPGCFVHGPDHEDYVTALAPKPVLIGAAAYDFFPIEGALECLRRARDIYRLYGAEERVDIAIAPTRHAYSAQLREACVGWFRRHLRGDAEAALPPAPPRHWPGPGTPEPDVLPEAELNVTDSGQVLQDYPASRTLFDLNRERLASLRPTPPAAPEALRRLVARALPLPNDSRSAPIFPRVIREDVADGYPVEKLFFFSAPDVAVTGVMVHPRGTAPVAGTELLLLEHGTNAIPQERDRIEVLLRAGKRVFVFDPRGIGGVETRPISPGSVQGIYRTEYRLACDAMMLGLSTLGLRVFDVLRALDYLRAREDVDSGTVGISAVGEAALTGYFAAVLEDGFRSVTLEGMLATYRDLAETRYYSVQSYPLRCVPYGLLAQFDLPDLLPCLAGRSVTFVRPRNAHGEVLTPQAFEEKFLHATTDSWKPNVA